MRTLSALPRLILFTALGILSVDAQDAAKATPRNFRFLVIGDYAPPYFEKKGDVWMEVDPPAKLIAPRSIKPLLEPESTSAAPSNKIAELPLRFNQIVEMPNYRCGAKLRLSLGKSTKSGADEKEISCELGNLVEPLVMIFADVQGGWDRPQIRVLDFSASAVPAGSTHVSNLTPFPLGVRIENAKAALAPNQQQILKGVETGNKPFRYRVDLASGNATAPLANSSYQLKPAERLLIVAVPDSTIKDRPPVTLRLITDRLTPPNSAADRATR